MNIPKRLFDKICLFFVISLIFISCSDFSSGKEWTNISSKGRISISTNLSNAESRTVLPNGSFFAEASGYKWELSAQKSGETSSKVVGTWEDVINSTTGIITTAYKNMTEGSFDVLIDVGTYNFNLVATKDGKRVLEGSIINGNIVSGECNRLNFTMKEASGTDIANGSINFKLILKNIGVVSNIKANLSKLAGSAVVSDENLTPITADNKFCEYVVFENDSISAGNYMLKLELQQNDVEETIGVYTCIIRVAPGLCSQGEYILEELAELYTVTYQENGGTFDSTISAVPTSYNAYTSVVLPTPTREGYAFGGWYNNANLTGEKITQIAKGSAGNITLYAKWLQLYTITYNLNGGENNTNNPTSYTVETETITLADPTKDDKNSFLGWYNDSGEVITEIKPSETAANITVTARWRTTCTVSEAKSVILALSGEGPHDIVVIGEITNVDVDIQAIKDGLIHNPDKNVKVNLDLSETTGWNSFSTYAFEGRDNLISIIIPDSVTSIGTYAFQNCSNLKSINIPNGVTSIETNTFNGCSSLTEITIPDSVTSIAYNAFYNCNSVKTLIIGKNLTSFDNLPITSALESITIGNSITEIGDNSFKDFTNLKSVTIGSGVTSIGGYAFSGCSSLTSVTFAENSKLTTIGEFSFYQCTSLKSIDIPDSVTIIGEQAFNSCSSLESVEISENAIQLLESTFFQCTNLKSVIIPDSVTTVGMSVFSGCTNLESVKIGAGMTEIGNFMFYNCKFTSIIIPVEIKTIGMGAFGDTTNSQLKTVNYRGTEEDWSSINITSTYNGSLTNATKYYNYQGE